VTDVKYHYVVIHSGRVRAVFDNEDDLGAWAEGYVRHHRFAEVWRVAENVAVGDNPFGYVVGYAERSKRKREQEAVKSKRKKKKGTA